MRLVGGVGLKGLVGPAVAAYVPTTAVGPRVVGVPGRRQIRLASGVTPLALIEDRDRVERPVAQRRDGRLARARVRERLQNARRAD